MNRYSLILILLLFISHEIIAAKKNIVSNPVELTDKNTDTYYTGTAGVNHLLFDNPSTAPILSYKIYSSGEQTDYDPCNWILKGSDNGKKWIVIDEQKNQKFISRFQEMIFEVKKPGNYKQYMFEISCANPKNILKLADVILYNKNILKNWKTFRYPAVDFNVLDPDTKGAHIYLQLVQSPDEYIKYHAQKVAEILFFTDKDKMNDVLKLNYTLKDYDGISAKSGIPAETSIVYSTRHIEKSAQESLYKLDFETRGVLYHELTHAYQFEPKGIGGYGTNREFWACIEGIADAVRAEAGFFDMSTRKSGGDWLDGYRTTGFFLQWLTTKDPDAIRKIHLTVRDLSEWSFNEAIKIVFGRDKTIGGMWHEYQQFLRKEESTKK